MDATTLLGALSAALRELAQVLPGATGWPSPARLATDALTGGTRALLVVAVVAWVAGIVAVVLSATDGGAAGARLAPPRPTPPLPPRRVRAAAVVPPAPPVAVVRPRFDAAPGDRAPALAAPAGTPAPAGAVRAPASTFHLPAVPVRPAVAEREPAPAVVPIGPPVGTRCRRCTQPRCWPSTGERPPARVLSSSAPRACRTPLTTGTAHRCAGPDLGCGRGRCAAPPGAWTPRSSPPAGGALVGAR